MTNLILSPDALMGIMDRGYLAAQDTDPHFPIRLSAIGHCPRQLRMLLEGADKRDYSARSLRIFEQGTDRGSRLAEAFMQGFLQFVEHELDLDPNKFDVDLERTVWLSTNVRGEDAELAVQMCKAWLKMKLEEIDSGRVDDTWLPLRIDPNSGYLQVRGRIDMTLIDHDAKHFWIVDFKTKNSWGFKKLEEEGNGDDYEAQLLSYAAALPDELEDYTLQGIYIFYEDHDKREHKVLRVETNWTLLDKVTADITHVLRNWVHKGPTSESNPVYAARSQWTKAKHKGALGCLPWQCNYCSVGPVVGECLPKTLSLTDIRTPGSDVPKWEVVG